MINKEVLNNLHHGKYDLDGNIIMLTAEGRLMKDQGEVVKSVNNAKEDQVVDTNNINVLVAKNMNRKNREEVAQCVISSLEELSR